MRVNPIKCRYFFLVPVLTLLLLTLAPIYAQDGSLKETFDNPALPGWELSPGATVVNGVLRVPPGGAARHEGQWGERSLRWVSGALC